MADARLDRQTYVRGNHIPHEAFFTKEQNQKCLLWRPMNSNSVWWCVVGTAVSQCSSCAVLPTDSSLKLVNDRQVQPTWGGSPVSSTSKQQLRFVQQLPGFVSWMCLLISKCTASKRGWRVAECQSRHQTVLHCYFLLCYLRDKRMELNSLEETKLGSFVTYCID